ncbi:hypothetical protein RCL1_000471 [Eukaryota sp. TZLM3-RCL]
MTPEPLLKRARVDQDMDIDLEESDNDVLPGPTYPLSLFYRINKVEASVMAKLDLVFVSVNTIKEVIERLGVDHLRSSASSENQSIIIPQVATLPSPISTNSTSNLQRSVTHSHEEAVDTSPQMSVAVESINVVAQKPVKRTYFKGEKSAKKVVQRKFKAEPFRYVEEEVEENVNDPDYQDDTDNDDVPNILSTTSIDQGLQILPHDHETLITPDLFIRSLPANWYFRSFAELVLACMKFFDKPLSPVFIFEAVSSANLVNKTTGSIVFCSDLTTSWRHHVKRTFQSHRKLVVEKDNLVALTQIGKRAVTCLGCNLRTNEGIEFNSTIKSSKKYSLPVRMAPRGFKYPSVFDVLSELPELVESD